MRMESHNREITLRFVPRGSCQKTAHSIISHLDGGAVRGTVCQTVEPCKQRIKKSYISTVACLHAVMQAYILDCFSQ